MGNKVTMEKNLQTSSSDKKTYQTPSLKHYGSVSSLTTGGSLGAAENSMSSASDMATSSLILKENIVKIGTHFLGIGLYLFDYKPEFCDVCGYGRQFGVMAEEVEVVMPEAVSVHPDGYKMVNYAMLGISRSLN